MEPNHYLSVLIDYLFRHRPQWGAHAAVGKTVVSTALIDRVASALGRRLYEVPVGFKWFVDGSVRRLARLRRRGKRRRIVAAPRRHGVDHRQGRHRAGAAVGRNDCAHRARIRASCYARADDELRRAVVSIASKPPPRRHRKRGWRSCRPTRSQPTSWPARRSSSVLDRAPGNGAPIGGIKVVAASGWFAARPSGTEDDLQDLCGELQERRTSASAAAEAQEHRRRRARLSHRTADASEDTAMSNATRPAMHRHPALSLGGHGAEGQQRPSGPAARRRADGLRAVDAAPQAQPRAIRTGPTATASCCRPGTARCCCTAC